MDMNLSKLQETVKETGMLQSMGSQKVRCYLVTEQQISHYVYITSLFIHLLVNT